MAAAAIMLLLGVGVYTSDTVTEFRAHSNHNPEYASAIRAMRWRRREPSC